MWSTSGWVLLCAVSTLLGFVLSRRRPPPPRHPPVPPDETTFATLHTAALAAPSLRAGLTRDSARDAIRHLRALLGTSAVAVTDIDGVLAWDGAADCHREHASEHARTVFSSSRPYVVAGDALGCGTPGCVIRGAAVVPLTVDGRVVGALAAYDAEVSAALVRTATEVARWVSGQLELADLDSSRRRATEAEARALRAQISPHFVYNSLTTIASFVRTDPERARELLMDFADFTRHALRRGGDFTTLADELRCVDRYLLLERARFGERLRFTVQVAPEALPVLVPFLCLQPLVENAIKHGIAATGGSGEVRVVVRDTGSEAHISVEDDGLGMDPARARRLLDDDPRHGAGEGGIGLANVDVRLRHIYGEGYGLVVETALGAGTKIRLRVPKLPSGNSY
ncbi:two-component system LytT family sensor kinase [Streptosporangium album]|uniref:Two-component system LytT family sensor kinase n=1 Tax=Streptosporangium album TaxID=47479 RepID=A0A7W7S060_9ACTN|nr:histidine kinase [Streptosporangium album]MBB4941345.1 two-component system LytT family sensor kinase [Streptosporangium album]